MAAVTICSDLGAQKIICHCFHCFPIYLPWSDGTRCHDLRFWTLSFKPAFSLSFFTFIKRLFSSSLLCAIRVVSSAYLRLLIFLPAILIPAGASYSLAFFTMYSAYKLNKQGDNIQPWRSPFPNWNQSVVPSSVLTVASWAAYRFLRRQVRWSGIPISLRIFQFVVIHTVEGFGVVNKAEVDVRAVLHFVLVCLYGIHSFPCVYFFPMSFMKRLSFSCWIALTSFLIEASLICSVVLVSGVQQSDLVLCLWIYIYVCIYILFQILFHYRLIHYIKYSSLCSTVGPCCSSTLYIAVCISYSQISNLSFHPPFPFL